MYHLDLPRGVGRVLGRCSPDKITAMYFLCLAKVWSILYHGSVGRNHKKCYLMLLCFFGMLFFIIKFVFLSFLSLFLINYKISATEF